jgi:hypothetical protein
MTNFATFIPGQGPPKSGINRESVSERVRVNLWGDPETYTSTSRDPALLDDLDVGEHVFPGAWDP